ncbi:MAG TPA: primosomal protein N', partial [Burkholderiaceae bacterium]
MSGPLDYLSEHALPPGRLVRVPLGKRDLLGVVWPGEALSNIDEALLRPVTSALEALPPLGAPWLALVEFAAQYYQRSVGELAAAVLPPQLRDLDAKQLQAKLKKLDKKILTQGTGEEIPTLSAEQAEVLSQLDTLLQPRA